MSATVETKLYPTAQNTQLPPGDIPVSQFVAWLQRYQKSAPDAEESTAFVRNHAGLELHYLHTRTEVEVLKATHERLRQELLAAGRDPLAERLLALLG